MAGDARRYRAFISYSQRDKRWAVKLHKTLEAYRTPVGVHAPDLGPKTRKLGRFFRDDEEMGAAESLGAALQGAIDDSESLIVLCSPHSATSRWVDLEVRRFKRRGASRVFAVIVGGKPHSGDPRTECFCPALKEQVSPDGKLTGEPDEPLAPDWRKDRLARLKVRLAAGLLGVPFDDLWKRERRRAGARRMQALASLAAGLFVAGAIFASTVALVWRAQSLTRSQSLMALSEQALARDGLAPLSETQDRAMRFAVAAAHDSWIDPAASGAERHLAQLASRIQTQAANAVLSGSEDPFVVSPDRTRLIFSGDRYARMRSVDLATESPRLDDEYKNLLYYGFTSDSTKAAFAWASDRVVVLDASTAETLSDVHCKAQHDYGSLTRLSRSAQVSPDGAVFAYFLLEPMNAATPARIELCDVQTGAPLGAPWPVDSLFENRPQLIFSPAGGRFLVLTPSGAQLLDSPSGLPIGGSLSHEAALEGAVFTSDGARIVTWNSVREARVWDAEGAPLGPPLSLGGRRISAVAVAPDSVRAVAVLNNAAQLLDLVAVSPIGEPFAGDSSDGVDDAGFSPDGAFVWTRSARGRRRLWSVADQGASETPLGAGDIAAIDFSLDGAKIVTQSTEGAVQIWDAASLTPLGTPTRWPVSNEIRLLEDAKRVALFQPPPDGEMRLLDFAAQQTRPVVLTHVGLRTAVLSADEQMIATAGADEIALIWDADSGAPLRSLDHGAAAVRTVEFSSDGTQLLTTTAGGGTTVWDIATGEKRFSLQSDASWSHHAAFSPDGRRVAASSWGRVQAYDVATGAPIGEAYDTRDRPIFHVAWSPDGERIAAVGWFGVAVLLDASTGGLIHRFDTSAEGSRGALRWVGFSPSGALVAALGGDGEPIGVRIWDAATGVRVVDDPRDVDRSGGAVFSNDERRILTSTGGFSASVFDLQTAAEVVSLEGQDNFVAAAAFSPDETRIITAGKDGTARLWDVATGKQLGEPMRHRAAIHSLAPFADGRRVLTASEDGFAQVWEISPWLMGEGDRSRAGLAPLFDAVCGPEGRMGGAIRFLTPKDFEVAPALGDVYDPFDDVCEPPKPLRRAFRSVAERWRSLAGWAQDWKGWSS